ncbi:SurA N-terminal domain-containing protein [Candidatus Woesearchaeota archaeon]|nr:SurA N-terminal domain-containing protein [Candidatus Woesearchaeota archaeon]
MANQTRTVGLVLLASVLLIAGCSTPEQPQEPGPVETPGEEDIPVSGTGGVVAVVNDQEVSAEEVDALQRSFAQQGRNVSSDEALEHLIDQVVLAQKVHEEGITVSDEEAEAEIERQLSTQGVGLDEFKQHLESRGASYEDELEALKPQLAIQAFLRNKTPGEFNVSDEEVQAFYEMYKQRTPEEEQVPFEEIKHRIVSTLEQQRREEAINDLIQEYREEADVEYR